MPRLGAVAVMDISRGLGLVSLSRAHKSDLAPSELDPGLVQVQVCLDHISRFQRVSLVTYVEFTHGQSSSAPDSLFRSQVTHDPLLGRYPVQPTLAGGVKIFKFPPNLYSGRTGSTSYLGPWNQSESLKSQKTPLVVLLLRIFEPFPNPGCLKCIAHAYSVPVGMGSAGFEHLGGAWSGLTIWIFSWVEENTPATRSDTLAAKAYLPSVRGHHLGSVSDKPSLHWQVSPNLLVSPYLNNNKIYILKQSCFHLALLWVNFL